MAKCVANMIDWSPGPIERKEDTFVVEALKDGEKLLRKKFEDVTDQIYDIAHDYLIIAKSSTSMEKFDCTQIQDGLITKLSFLYSESSSIVDEICKSTLPAVTRHRYFILYTCEIVAKLQQLLHIVGRLSELDHSVYIEEQHKPFISEESITIHSLTLIWTGCVEILSSFSAPAQELFREHINSNESSFINSLEFSTAGYQQAKLFLVDLTVTSWIQFNRFTKHEELFNALPFLCYCHNKLYFNILERATREGKDLKTLPELLLALKENDNTVSNTVNSSKHYSLLPQKNWTREFHHEQADYFVVWHIVSLHKCVNDKNRPHVEACESLLKSSINAAMKQFVPISQPEKPQLSPFQEEKFKLMSDLLKYLAGRSKDSYYSDKLREYFYDPRDTIQPSIL